LIGDHLKSDVITCIGPIQQPFDDIIRDFVEDIPSRRESLLVILETDGGSIETAEGIADAIFRQHYAKEVSFLIPNFAMSAGTVLVMSGDTIYMDYYSILGPIDPQVLRDGRFVPALGYLDKYNELVAKSKRRAGLSQAELALFVQKFDPAELHRFEQARDHSVDLLKKWLVQYKFKNWIKTRTRGVKVTHQMRVKRAAEIASKLNDTKRWRSHGRGLSIDTLENDLNLMVENFGKDPHLNQLVRSYYRLLQDYLITNDYSAVCHTPRMIFSA
jgi:hypothetical protein